jgi:muconolactone delta-isomerase
VTKGELGPMDGKSRGGRGRARPPTSLPAADGYRQLFLVERRVPAIADGELAMLQAALTEASRRFTARGEHVRYLRSTFIPGQQRLLSLFAADNATTVRAVNEAALIPFASIEPAVELPGPGQQ